MTSKRKNYPATLKAKIVVSAIESKLTQAQLTSEYGVHATQIKAWKQAGLEAISDYFSGARVKANKNQEKLLADLYQEIGRLQAQLTWIKKKYRL